MPIPKDLSQYITVGKDIGPLSTSWHNLSWTEWTPIEEVVKQKFPKTPGIYRVRPRGINKLAYLGQTCSSIDRRVRKDLSATYLHSGDVMPFNDPHTAAQSLWVWHQAEGYDYEISLISLDWQSEDKTELKRYVEGLESFLLWSYRKETGDTSLFNHGRFNSHYTRSSMRSAGIRGQKLPDGKINNAGSEPVKPLILQGKPTDTNWMGLAWSSVLGITESIDKIEPLPGLYKIVFEGQVVYIGQSKNIKNRTRSHLSKMDSNGYGISISYLPKNTVEHHLLELENDLIGSFIETEYLPPLHQFTNSI